MTSNEPVASARQERATGEEMDQLAQLVQEIGFLKSVPRTGWTLAGIRNPESVADHSMRAAAIAYLLAVMAGANAERAVVLAVFHDLAEVRTGDLASVSKPYVKKEADEDVVGSQTAGCPVPVQEALGSAVAEYGRRETVEARIARDADKIECLAQALQYKAEGHPQAQLWVESMRESVRTAEGVALADALLRGEADAWWRNAVADYRPSMSPEPGPGEA